MPVCCFGNQNQEQSVQPVQVPPMVQPIVMPLMNLCPSNASQGVQTGITGNSYVPQQPLGNNGYGGSQEPISSGIIGNTVPQNITGNEQTHQQPNNVLPQGGITINISNSQDRNSKNTAFRTEAQSQIPQRVVSTQQPSRIVQRQIIHRMPFVVTRDRIRTQIKTKTYYKMVRVPVRVDNNVYKYVNRFVPYNACEGATPHNVNNGFV